VALLGNTSKKNFNSNPSPWRFDRSLCWWTLRALGAKGVPPLTVNDNAGIWELHQDLNKLVASSSSKSDLSKFGHLVKLAQETESHTPQRRNQHLNRNALRQLMELVVRCANAVATTPVTSTSKIYQCFNDLEARAVVFDEAATMFCSDALMVYGNTPRPMVAIGDPKQLAPSLTTAFEMLYGEFSKAIKRWDHESSDTFRAKPIPTNRFARFSEISWLSWFIHLGWPVFHMYTQHRMAEGLFDISLNTVYKNLKPHFQYSPLCNPANFSLGLKVEKYLKAEYRIPPADTSQPVFFHCSNCKCVERSDGISRINLRQADLIARFLVKMIEKLQLPTEDIVVLTPYRANMAAIARRFGSESGLENVTVSTFSRFQGREAHIVILALCVDADTGPLFVADERSLNVALTRQRSSLLIFGDTGTTPYKLGRGKDGQPRFNQGMINGVFEMISNSGRIVRVDGDDSVDHYRFEKNKKSDATV